MQSFVLSYRKGVKPDSIIYYNVKVISFLIYLSDNVYYAYSAILSHDTCDRYMLYKQR